MHTMESLLHSLAAQVIAFRRDIHKYPELGWQEYRTASKIIELFQSLGYEVCLGEQAVQDTARLTPPTQEQCAREKARAIIQGANPALVERMGHGLTGLWVDIPLGKGKRGENKGPLVALRFDMDANELKESAQKTHVPTAAGFQSQNTVCMHACGHDGHVAMGVGLGLILHALRTQAQLYNAEHLCGTVRLIFQPAEEIGQGAKAMLAAGAMVDVDFLYGIHLGIQAQDPSTLICGTTDFLANTTFEVTFEGRAAHSGLAPQEGRNALLAAATAVQGMHSIARHGKGLTRVNVGQLQVQGAPNVIPSKAFLVGETRADDTDINTWMCEEAQRICQGAAHMWGCTCTFSCIGTCVNGYSDMPLAQEVFTMAQSMPCFDRVLLSEKFLASEDFTWLLQDVQQRGGQGTFIQLGVQLCGGHHTSSFDFDEAALMRGLELLARLVWQKLGE